MVNKLSVKSTLFVVKEGIIWVLVQFAFATLCVYFAGFAVPLFVYHKGREETAKKRKEMQVQSGKLKTAN